jgi:Ca-activated chloride channel family protein
MRTIGNVHEEQQPECVGCRPRISKKHDCFWRGLSDNPKKEHCLKCVLRNEASVMARFRTGLLLSSIILFSPTFLRGQDEKSPIPSFRVDVATVFVNAAVSDPLNRYVTGLEKENFKIYEDNVLQPVTHFSQESAPISVGFLFDISGSMGYNRNIRLAKRHFLPFLESRNPEDEYFLITFNKTVSLVEAFTEETGEVQNEIAVQKPGGWTALYDAVYLGLDQMKKAKNEKKALILISDGEDNSSRYPTSEVREFSKESDVQIYAIGLSGPLSYGQGILRQLTSQTGGRVFFPDTGDLSYYIELIHTELRTQYLLGYTPTNQAQDGKWRRIAIKLDAPRGFPKLSIRAKQGYYAARN